MGFTSPVRKLNRVEPNYHIGGFVVDESCHIERETTNR